MRLLDPGALLRALSGHHLGGPAGVLELTEVVAGGVQSPFMYPAALVDATHWEGGPPRRWAVLPDRQAICCGDDDVVLCIFGPGYNRHQTREWLLPPRWRHRGQSGA